MSETIPAPIDEAGQEGRTQVPVKIWLVFAAAGILLGHYLLHQLSISAESAVRLSEAQLMLAGAVPYVDFFDNVSPFYIYFNLLPASLSQLMHLHPILIFNCLICLLFVLSALALISFSAVGTGRATWRNPLCGSKWPCLLAFVSLVLFQPVHFGQANQLFFIAMTPYIVCRALRLRGLRIGSKLALLVGMAVGLCVLLDPLYAIFFLIFEASTVWGLYPFAGFALIKKRYLGPELQFALAIALLLGSVFALIPCACARHYILDVIPINLDGYIEVL
ncbi:MAG: hypothetical protein KGS72_15650, partial [Cyanobacteria bacterium REEB67]|nr:hypothetical protein [Cyanobacteria bacterium REEB67]